MARNATLNDLRGATPRWLPESILIFIAHKRYGLSMRQIARELDIQPSTVSRNIKRTSHKLTDPLFEAGLKRVSLALPKHDRPNDQSTATLQPAICCLKRTQQAKTLLKEDKFRQESKRLLEALSAPNKRLVLSPELDNAVIINIDYNATSRKQEYFDRSLAEALVMNDWIEIKHQSRLLSYAITDKARNHIRHCSAIDTKKKTYLRGDLSKSIQPIHTQLEVSKTVVDKRTLVSPEKKGEAPILALSRLRDKAGESFLNSVLVTAGQLLREDFELSSFISSIENTRDMGSETSPSPITRHSSIETTDPEARLAQALHFLGPGLSDVAVRCCCHLQGMEQIEKELNWSARSGKIVLRIALMQLVQFYKLETPTKVTELVR